MSRVVAIHQPNYLPGLRYFAKMAQADIFVLLDCVAYSKNNWTNRNRIRRLEGARWLTVPVRTSGNFGQQIKDVKVADTSWQAAHLRALQEAYAGTPFLDEVMALITARYAQPWDRLAEGNIALIRSVAGQLNIDTELLLASELDEVGQGTRLLCNLAKRLGASTYLSGVGGKKYLDVDLFHAAGIGIAWQEYVHPTYNQTGSGFVPDLSVVDLLLNVGREAGEILRSGMEG